MKKAHFQYVGYPRAGSTFMNRVFRQQSQLKDCTNNVIKEFYCNNLEEYKNTYSKFDYSINMHTIILLTQDRDYLQMTDPVTDKFFACIRNPYEAFASSFALWDGHFHNTAHARAFANCAENLIFLKSVITKPFKIFYFEDLVNNEHQYIADVCEFLEIETPVVDTANLLKHSSKEIHHNITSGPGKHFISKQATIAPGPVVPRAPLDLVPEYKFDDQEIEYFNQKITELEQYLDRDFAHWKR